MVGRRAILAMRLGAKDTRHARLSRACSTMHHREFFQSLETATRPGVRTPCEQKLITISQDSEILGQRLSYRHICIILPTFAGLDVFGPI